MDIAQRCSRPQFECKCYGKTLMLGAPESANSTIYVIVFVHLLDRKRPQFRITPQKDCPATLKSLYNTSEKKYTTAWQRCGYLHPPRWSRHSHMPLRGCSRTSKPLQHLRGYQCVQEEHWTRSAPGSSSGWRPSSYSRTARRQACWTYVG